MSPMIFDGARESESWILVILAPRRLKNFDGAQTKTVNNYGHNHGQNFVGRIDLNMCLLFCFLILSPKNFDYEK